MAVTVEKLKVDLTFDTTNLRKGFADSIKDVKAFESSIGGLSQKIKTFAIAAAAGLSVKAVFDDITASVKKAADAGSALVDMRDRTGIAIESLEHLKFAADQSGASIEKLELAVKKMQKEINHNTTAAKFEQIGLSLASLRKLSPEDQLIAIGDAISKLPNPTARAAAAMEIFGKSGTDLLPMFKEGKNGVAALIKESKRLGGVWTNESAEAAEKFGDNLKKLEIKSERFSIWIGNIFIPVLNDLSEAWLDLGAAIKPARDAISEASRHPFRRPDPKAEEANARRLWQKQGLDNFIAKLEKVADTQLEGLKQFFAEKPSNARGLADALGLGDVFRAFKGAAANVKNVPDVGQIEGQIKDLRAKRDDTEKRIADAGKVLDAPWIDKTKDRPGFVKQLENKEAAIADLKTARPRLAQIDDQIALKEKALADAKAAAAFNAKVERAKEPIPGLKDAFAGLKDALGVGPGPLGKLMQMAGPFGGLVNNLGAAFAPLNAVVDAAGKIGNAFAGVFGKDGEEKPGKKLGDKGSDELKAFQFGSAEALNAVAKSRNDANLRDKTPEKQLKEAKEANVRLNGIIDAINRVPGWKVANL